MLQRWCTLCTVYTTRMRVCVFCVVRRGSHKNSEYLLSFLIIIYLFSRVVRCAFYDKQMTYERFGCILTVVQCFDNDNTNTHATSQWAMTHPSSAIVASSLFSRTSRLKRHTTQRYATSNGTICLLTFSSTFLVYVCLFAAVCCCCDCYCCWLLLARWYVGYTFAVLMCHCLQLPWFIFRCVSFSPVSMARVKSSDTESRQTQTPPSSYRRRMRWIVVIIARSLITIFLFVVGHSTHMRSHACFCTMNGSHTQHN